MSLQKLPVPGSSFVAEVSIATFKLSGAAIAFTTSILATVTLASHLKQVGDFVTFSGGTGNTTMNNQTFQVLTVPTSGTYTIAVSPAMSAAGAVGGTIVQEGVALLGGVNPGVGANTANAAGLWMYTLGANGILEYNPDNNFGKNGPGGGLEVWRTLAAASTAGMFFTDGYSVRFRQNGTTATSLFSQVM